MQTDSTVSPQDNLTVSDEKLCKNIKPIDNISYDSDKKMFNFNDTDQITVNNNVLLRYNMTDDMKPVYEREYETDQEYYWRDIEFSSSPTIKGTVEMNGIIYQASLFPGDTNVGPSSWCLDIEQGTTCSIEVLETKVCSLVCYATENQKVFVCLDVTNGTYTLNRKWNILVRGLNDSPNEIPDDWKHSTVKLHATTQHSLSISVDNILYKDNANNTLFQKTWNNI